MIIIQVTHFLNKQGLKHFPQWFDKLETIISQFPGYMNIAYRLNQHDSTAHIILLFADQEKLTAWAKSQEHDQHISLLDAYKRKHWESEKIDTTQ